MSRASSYMKSLPPSVSGLQGYPIANQATRLLVPCRQSPQQHIVNNIAHTRKACSERSYATRTTPSLQSRKGLVLGLPSFFHRPGCRYSSNNLRNGLENRALDSTGVDKAPEAIIYDVFEDVTGTWQFIIADPSTLNAVIIDPVLDYDRATQVITTQAADKLLSIVKKNGYSVDMILETHAHADHLTAASYLQRRLSEVQRVRPAIGIGKRIIQVQKLFGERYGIPVEEYEGVFDKLFDDDETFNIGKLSVTALHLPGHTPDHLGYKIGDNVFCGDSLFHADIGTARCDFPGGSAKDLFNSGRKLLELPKSVKIWPGHDYPPEERVDPQPWMTVQQHKEQNMHLKDGMAEEEFIAMRQERDTKLAAPKLVHQSLQFNIRAGRLPASMGPAGFRLLHLPLKLDCVEW